jgi:hypothetical protein
MRNSLRKDRNTENSFTEIQIVRKAEKQTEITIAMITMNNEHDNNSVRKTDCQEDKTDLRKKEIFRKKSVKE